MRLNPFRIAWICAVLAQTFAGAAAAAQLVSTIPTTDSANEVQLVGSRAYVADGAGGLRIYDLGTPSSPAFLGSAPPLPGGAARGVDVVGTRAYVANGGPGVQIVDVSNPAAPAQLGSFDPPGNTFVVRAAGATAYAAGAFGLYLFDVSNPFAPAPLGTFAMPAIDALRSNGTIAVVTTAVSPGFRVLDVSNPLAPALLGSIPDVRGTIDLQGSIAWLNQMNASGPNELIGVNLSNPAAPAVLGRVAADYSQIGRGLAVRGRLAFAGALEIADIHGLGMPGPASIGSTPLAYWGDDVEIAGTAAIVALNDVTGGGQGGLALVDITDATHPAIVGNVNLGRSFGVDVVMAGAARLADVATATGLSIVNVTAPSAPAIVGGLALPGFALDVDVDGATAFVASVSAPGIGCTLRAVDVSNPAAPALRDTLALSGGAAWTVIAAGGVAWVSCTDAVYAVDVSDPANLVEINSIPFADTVGALDRDGDLLYVRTAGGLFVMNVADPLHPVPLDTLPSVAGTARFDASMRSVYAPGLSIVDARNPAALRLVNQVPTSTIARSMRAIAGRAYIGEAGSFEIFDVATRGELAYAQIASIPGPGSGASTDVDLSTGLAVGASGLYGVRVFDVAPDIAAHPCIDGLDNDGDGLIDVGADPGCTAGDDGSERPACSDGLDNDADGLIDFPADPGCGSTLGQEAPQCQDGVDNDGDGAIDYPADLQCMSARDDDELSNSACGLLGIEPLVALALARAWRRRPWGLST